jgi:hypothetical protein
MNLGFAILISFLTIPVVQVVTGRKVIRLKAEGFQAVLLKVLCLQPILPSV